LVEKARFRDADAEVLDILSKIQHSDVDNAMMFVWQEDPLNHPWMIWGYECNGQEGNPIPRNDLRTTAQNFMQPSLSYASA
jgi:hypothetical protein